MEFLTVNKIKGRKEMRYLSNNYSEIFKKGIHGYINDLVSDTKSAYKGFLYMDISDKLNLKPNASRSFLKVLSGLMDDAARVLSDSVNWDVEEDLKVINEVIYMLAEFDRLNRALNCIFNVLSFIRLAELSKLKIILCGTRKISARSDSYFKCILGHYRGKYRRLTTASDMSFINASSVCGGEV